MLTGDTFKELGLENIVKKAVFISNNEREIWNLFNKETPGFFTKCIMSDYRIDTDFTGKLMKDYKYEIQKIKRVFESKHEDICRNLKMKIVQQEDIIEELQQKVIDSKRAILPEIGKIRDSIDQAIIKKCQKSVQEIMNYKDNTLNEYRKKMDTTNPHIDKEMSIEFRDLQDQSVHWRREIAYVKVLKIKNECLMFQHKELYEKSLIENLSKSEMIVTLRQRNKELELQSTHYGANEEMADQYVKLLEKELKDTQTILEKERIYNPLIELYEINPLPKIRADAQELVFKNRGKNIATQDKFINGSFKAVGTITEIFLTDRNIIQGGKYMNPNDLVAPKCE